MHIHQQNHWNDTSFYWYQSYNWYQWTIGLTNRIRLCILDMCVKSTRDQGSTIENSESGIWNHEKYTLYFTLYNLLFFQINHLEPSLTNSVFRFCDFVSYSRFHVFAILIPRVISKAWRQSSRVLAWLGSKHLLNQASVSCSILLEMLWKIARDLV